MLDFRVYTFLKLCETRSYTKTAELMHISQPAVSQHIKFLENEYQAKFFFYDEQKQLKLSPQGQLFFQYASAASVNAKKISSQLTSPKDAPPTFCIGATPSFGAEMLPQIIAEYLKTNEANISLWYGSDRNLRYMLQSGEIDIAILNNNLPIDDMVSRLLFHDKTACFCSRNHPLAEKTVHLSNLYDQRLLIGYKGSDFNSNVNALLKKNNSNLGCFKHFLELGPATAIKNQLQCMDAITFMFSVIFHKEVQSGLLKQIYISDFNSSHSMFFCYLKNVLFSDVYDRLYQLMINYISSQMFDNQNITL